MGGRKLYRDTEHKMILGVCAGIAEYFRTDVSIVRLIALALILAGGGGLLLYLIAAIIIPDKPKGAEAPKDEVKESK